MRMIAMPLTWKKGALALAAVFLLAIVLVKPIGVSTQFVIFDGVIASAIDKNLIEQNADTKTGYSSTNEYLAKSDGKYAKSIANPVNYDLIFVFSMIFGGFLASRKHKEPALPKAHVRRFGNSPAIRYTLTFIGGFIALFGARLAGGCTSGHMMSGMMQTSVSGYLFALAAFAVAIPTAMIVYGKKGA
ncbi:YeeE/YedE thiosulfate transporter family protein [Vibrio parahaemolyticus]|uniref:YeeE/YedE thiosulfate transporter family protein n=1 Tax=Vibrio parahaemolyticus TaxID=670 RepID=UPI0030811AF6